MQVAFAKLPIVAKYLLNLLASVLVEFSSDVGFYVFGVQDSNLKGIH